MNQLTSKSGGQSANRKNRSLIRIILLDTLVINLPINQPTNEETNTICSGRTLSMREIERDDLKRGGFWFLLGAV